jgi:hypothetical protein
LPYLESSYYNFVVPEKKFTNIPKLGIHVYPFCLEPEEHQPSGTANFAKIPKVVLRLIFNSDLAKDNSYTIRVYSVAYNIFRIMSGIGGLAFAI